MLPKKTKNISVYIHFTLERERRQISLSESDMLPRGKELIFWSHSQTIPSFTLRGWDNLPQTRSIFWSAYAAPCWGTLQTWAAEVSWAWEWPAPPLGCLRPEVWSRWTPIAGAEPGRGPRGRPNLEQYAARKVSTRDYGRVGNWICWTLNTRNCK
jgi:hypothetical protein